MLLHLRVHYMIDSFFLNGSYEMFCLKAKNMGSVLQLWELLDSSFKRYLGT
jgi:hypothetical protein